MSAIDRRSPFVRVPGREAAVDDRADIFSLDLRAGEPVTVQVCGVEDAQRRAFTPELVATGPSGAPFTHIEPRRRVLESILVVRPVASGAHSVYVVHDRARAFGRYQLIVHRGVVTDPPADACIAGAY